MMTEEVVYYHEQAAKYGIYSYPAGKRASLPLVIFLNAGLVNRQGPHRVYVNLCRELTAAGFACFRFDLPGIGDALNHSKRSTRAQIYLEELGNVIWHFREERGVQSFVLLGLCTGADLAFDYALGDPSIAGVCMINGTRLPKRYAVSHIQERYYKKYLTDPRRWLKLLDVKKAAKIPRYALMAAAMILKKLRERSAAPQPATALPRPERPDHSPEGRKNWIRLVESNVPILQIIAEGSETLDDLNNLDQEVAQLNEKRKNYRQQLVYDADHTFTSVRSQQYLTGQVLEWCRHQFAAQSKAVATA